MLDQFPDNTSDNTFALIIEYLNQAYKTSLRSFRRHHICRFDLIIEIVSEYDQEIPQSQTADNPVAPRGRAAQPSRDTRKTN